MSDDASAGPATSAMHDSERVLQRVETAVTRIGAVAGAAAATVVLVAVVGGAVMWLRFRNAGLPADQAVALVPRTDLIVIGLRLMVLPVAAAGVLSAGYAWRQRSRTQEEGAGAEAAAGAPASAPIAVTACEPGGWAPAARRVTAMNGAGGDARDGAASPIGSPAETVPAMNGTSGDASDGAAVPIGSPAETAATVDGTRGDGWRRQEAAWMLSRRAAASGLMTRARPPLLRILAVLVVLALVLCVPFTAGALAWPLAAVLLLHHHRRVCRTCPRRPDRGVPVWRLAAAAMLAAALVSVARQVDPPVQLPSVHVVAGGEAVDGTLVTANASTVALAPIGSRSIRVYRRSDVRELLVGPPLDRRAPGRSLLSRLLAGRAWAATPLDVWCGGEHYSWWRLGAACRTQPAVERPVFRSGRSVVATLACPRPADGGCAGFVTVRTRDAFTADGARQPVILGQSEFRVRNGTAGAVHVPMSRAARRIVASRPGRAVAVRVVLSRDLAGDAPVPGASLTATIDVGNPRPGRPAHGDTPRTRSGWGRPPGGGTGGGSGGGTGGGSGPRAPAPLSPAPASPAPPDPAPASPGDTPDSPDPAPASPPDTPAPPDPVPASPAVTQAPADPAGVPPQRDQPIGGGLAAP